MEEHGNLKETVSDQVLLITCPLVTKSVHSHCLQKGDVHLGRAIWNYSQFSSLAPILDNMQE